MYYKPNSHESLRARLSSSVLAVALPFVVSFVLASVVVTSVAIAVVTSPAYASILRHGDDSDGHTHTGSAASNVIASIKDERLAAVISATATEIERRTAQIETLTAKIDNARADCGANSLIKSQLKADKSGLETLKQQSSASTTLESANAARVDVFQNYRIFALETPKTNIAVACALVLSAQDAIGETVDALNVLIRAREAQGKDLTAVKSTIANATSLADQAVLSAKTTSTTSELKADEGDAELRIENQAELTTARQAIRNSRTSLQSARDSLRSAIAQLRAL